MHYVQLNEYSTDWIWASFSGEFFKCVVCEGFSSCVRDVILDVTAPDWKDWLCKGSASERNLTVPLIVALVVLPVVGFNLM